MLLQTTIICKFKINTFEISLNIIYDLADVNFPKDGKSIVLACGVTFSFTYHMKLE